MRSVAEVQWPGEVPPARHGPSTTPYDLCAALTAAAAAVRQPDVPAGLAMALTVLWSRLHSFDAAAPSWPDRDRFVLCCAGAAPLLHGLLHLTGHPGLDPASLDCAAGQDAVAAQLAEFGRHPAIEAPAAPGGQTVAIATGMAIAERAMAARFGKSLVDHRVWAVAAAAELCRGVTHEAAALAGQLRLDRLVLLADATDPATEDARARYSSLNWTVKTALAGDPEDIAAALSFAVRSRKPTLVWCVAGGALAMELSGNAGQQAARDAWQRLGSRGAVARRAWLKRFARHPQRAEFERVAAGRLPDGWQDGLAVVRQQLRQTRAPAAPARIAQRCLAALPAAMPELQCSHLAAAWPADPAVDGVVAPARTSIGWGSRAQGMAACVTGIALHGGCLPVAVSGLADVGEQQPALRLAATLRRRTLHLAIDPGLARCGSWRPSDLLGCLRAIPQLHVFRPGCAMETVDCMDLALRRADGPCLVVLASDVLPVLQDDAPDNRCARGGYVLIESAGPRQATLIATGAELALAAQAHRMLLDEGLNVAVVSLPCWALFAAQSAAYRRDVLGGAPRIGLEAAGRAGWDRWLGEGELFIGCEGPDAAGAEQTVRRSMGLTATAVADAIRRRVAAREAKQGQGALPPGPPLG